MSSNITLRLEKGTELSYQEMDDNFTDIRKIYRFTEDSVVTTGSGAAYIITSTNTPQTSLVSNMMFGFIASFTNTADDPTLVIDTLDSRQIRRGNGAAMFTGEIQQGVFYIVRYDSASNQYRILENPLSIEPTGIIKLWSGTIATIPAGYAICDGTNGTPDLRSVFVLGAGERTEDPDPGDTGGSLELTTEEAGEHDHGGDTGGTAITVAQMPNHDHNLGGIALYREPKNEASNFGPDYDPPDNDGRTITAQGEGGNQAHDHPISEDGIHTHTITDARPPWYALAYIMKL